jgi:hypothetical protein
MHTPRQDPLMTREMAGRITDYLINKTWFIDPKEPLPILVSRLCFLIEEEMEKVVAAEVARLKVPSPN